LAIEELQVVGVHERATNRFILDEALLDLIKMWLTAPSKKPTNEWQLLIPPFPGSIPGAPAKQSRVWGVLRPVRQKARQFGISRELRHTGEGGTEPIATPDTRISPSAIGVLRFGD